MKLGGLTGKIKENLTRFADVGVEYRIAKKEPSFSSIYFLCPIIAFLIKGSSIRLVHVFRIDVMMWKTIIRPLGNLILMATPVRLLKISISLILFLLLMMTSMFSGVKVIDYNLKDYREGYQIRILII